jgi:hypothetical protein
MTPFVNYMRTLDLDTLRTIAEGEYDLVTYYTDALSVYDKYSDELWEWLCETTKNVDPGLTPISAMTFSRASSHEMFITDFVNYIAMLVADRLIEEEVKKSKDEARIEWVRENYPED